MSHTLTLSIKGNARNDDDVGSGFGMLYHAMIIIECGNRNAPLVLRKRLHRFVGIERDELKLAVGNDLRHEQFLVLRGTVLHDGHCIHLGLHGQENGDRLGAGILRDLLQHRRNGITRFHTVNSRETP